MCFLEKGRTLSPSRLTLILLHEQIAHLEEWKNHRNEFLDEELYADGLRGRQLPYACHRCQTARGEFRCEECIGSEMYCDVCISTLHRAIPLHRIKVHIFPSFTGRTWYYLTMVFLQRWTGEIFQLSSLTEAGLIIDFGHDGTPCISPATPANLTVIDLSGFHVLRVRYCGCGTGASSQHWRQIRRAGWWPCTIQRPRTAITIRTLRFHETISLQSKANAYDFYNTLTRVTDGTGAFVDKVHALF